MSELTGVTTKSKKITSLAIYILLHDLASCNFTYKEAVVESTASQAIASTSFLLEPNSSL